MQQTNAAQNWNVQVTQGDHVTTHEAETRGHAEVLAEQVRYTMPDARVEVVGVPILSHPGHPCTCANELCTNAGVRAGGVRCDERGAAVIVAGSEYVDLHVGAIVRTHDDDRTFYSVEIVDDHGTVYGEGHGDTEAAAVANATLFAAAMEMRSSLAGLVYALEVNIRPAALIEDARESLEKAVPR